MRCLKCKGNRHKNKTTGACLLPTTHAFISYKSLSWHPTLFTVLLARVPDGDRVVFGAKTLSFCSLTFDRVSIPPDWFPLLSHLCLHLHLFPLSFLSSLFVEALTRMRREPFKMSGNASWYLSSALGIDLSGQFVPRVAKTLMRSSAAKFLGGWSYSRRKRLSLTILVLWAVVSPSAWNNDAEPPPPPQL